MNNSFLKLCHLLLSITFWFILFASVLSAFTDAFMDSPQIKISESSYFGGYAHHEYGYPLVVQPNIPSHTQTSHKNDTLVTTFDRPLILHYDFNTELIADKEMSLEKGTIYAKTRHGSIHLLAGIKHYTGTLLLIIIFWFARKLVKSLINHTHFKIKTTYYLKALGITLILSFLLIVVFDVLIGMQINYFELKTFKDEIQMPYSRITFNPSINFEWVYLIIGLISLGARSLFNHGNILQNENDLTI